MEAEILEVVSNVGFPIAISLWFMLRTEKIIDKNTEALENLKDAVELFHQTK